MSEVLFHRVFWMREEFVRRSRSASPFMNPLVTTVFSPSSSFIQLLRRKMVAVLFVVTSHEDLGTTGKKTGWYLPEVAHPYHVFKNAGYEMTFVSPKGGKAPMDPGSGEAFKDDPICKEFLLPDSDGLKAINNTKTISSVDPTKFDVVFCAGGHGPMFDLPSCEALNKAIATVYEKGGIASAVCHGPAGIVDTKLSNGEYLVKDQKVTCFTNEEEAAVQLVEAMPFLLETRLKEHGAIFQNAPSWKPFVVASNRVVTGQNPASATPMAEKVVEVLNTK